MLNETYILLSSRADMLGKLILTKKIESGFYQKSKFVNQNISIRKMKVSEIEEVIRLTS